MYTSRVSRVTLAKLTNLLEGKAERSRPAQHLEHTMFLTSGIGESVCGTT